MKGGGVAPNEVTYTTVVRLAVAPGDGDLAFDILKQMVAANLAPK
jgi:pentatricopeptide repeat protein